MDAPPEPERPPERTGQPGVKHYDAPARPRASSARIVALVIAVAVSVALLIWLL